MNTASLTEQKGRGDEIKGNLSSCSRSGGAVSSDPSAHLQDGSKRNDSFL